MQFIDYENLADYMIEIASNMGAPISCVADTNTTMELMKDLFKKWYVDIGICDFSPYEYAHEYVIQVCPQEDGTFLCSVEKALNERKNVYLYSGDYVLVHNKVPEKYIEDIKKHEFWGEGAFFRFRFEWEDCDDLNHYPDGEEETPENDEKTDLLSNVETFKSKDGRLLGFTFEKHETDGFGMDHRTCVTYSSSCEDSVRQEAKRHGLEVD